MTYARSHPDVTAGADQLILGDGGELPAGGTVLFHERFERTAADHPDRPALLAGHEELSYRELDERANRLARELRARGVGPEVLVGICLPRRASAIVSVLAVLKAGGAYVWLEPSHPLERRLFMLRDAGARLVISDPALVGDFAEPGLEALTPDVADGGDPSPPTWPAPALENLAYIMYTSGSTGTPKGVMIEHRSLSAFVEWGGDTFGADELEGVLLATSLGFDACIFELFVPLGCGGRIVFIDSLFAIDRVPAGQITMINSVPSLMTAFLEHRPLPESVRTVVLVGEVMSPRLADRIYAEPCVQRLVNAYGPTEDTCFSTIEEVVPGRPPTIGRPLPGTQAYVLDPEQRLVAPGEEGELCLGGAGLARGYRNRETLTRERFVPNPFPGTPSERLYRTGDLARWEPGGTLQHLGRIDHQIKVRGVRIEPGEIETALLRHDGITQALAVAHTREDGERRLVAYVVGEPDVVADAMKLREFLRRTLPESMVPSAFVPLDELPLNANGKLDRSRLPEPPAPRIDSAELTPLEEQLAEIWIDVLDLSTPPGPYDDFFDIGGTSLVAFKLFDLIGTRMGFELPPSTLIERGTLRALAECIEFGTGGTDRYSCVHGSGSRVPWIYVHPGAGGVFTLRRFADAAGPDQPIYGFQGFPEDEELEGEMPSVPEATDRLMEGLFDAQPSGPYLLSGHSIGAHVAFELACRLQAAGEEVPFLALLDPVAPHALRWRGRLSSRARELAGLGPEGRRPRYVRSGLAAAARGARFRVRRAKEQAAPGPVEHDDDAWLRGLLVLERSWDPGRFHGDVIVLRTTETARAAGLATLGWDRYVTGTVHVVPVPGDHVSMLVEPHVHVLARELAEHLGESQRALR